MRNIYGQYKNARNNAWQILIDYNITTLPVDIVSIANAADIKILKNCDVDILQENVFGVSIFRSGKWYIVYDDTMNIGRKRFTIAHELGHIFLGHPLRIGYHARTIDTEKPQIETEADIFASRLLAPACVIWGLGLHTPEEIQKTCNISYTAAKIRAERMELLYRRNMFLTSPLERQVYNNFENYIKQYKKY